MKPSAKIRVLIVEDSAVDRRAIAEALSGDSGIEVVGAASDPYVARDKILELNPDVLTLDVEMPRMDGLTFLRALQLHRPTPAVIISSFTPLGSRRALEALAFGAVDIIAKPKSAAHLRDFRGQLPFRIQAAASARLGNLKPSVARNSGFPVNAPILSNPSPRQLILIGGSTGGTEAIQSVLSGLPEGLPGICIVQHIPPVFSTAFASRLNECCRFEVREAAPGDEVRPGLALIAPGDYHMRLFFEDGCPRVHLDKGPSLHFTRPAVDVLFSSAASCIGPGTVAVLFSGMGADGACGMQKLKQQGACTIVQDEATSVVYGMPRAAVQLGVVDHVLSLDRIPAAILSGIQRRNQEARFRVPASVKTFSQAL